MDTMDDNPASLFMVALGVDESIAKSLVASHFTSIEELAYVPAKEISEVQGIDENLAVLLQKRAKQYLDTQVIQRDLDGEAK